MSELPLDLCYEPVMPADRSPGIGCIGAGFIMADCHLVAYRNAGFHPVAISPRTESKALWDYSNMAEFRPARTPPQIVL